MSEEQFEEKFIHLQQMGDDAIPMSSVDAELLRKFTGSISFHMDDYEDVHNLVAEHGYMLEVLLNPDEDEQTSVPN